MSNEYFCLYFGHAKHPTVSVAMKSGVSLLLINIIITMQVSFNPPKPPKSLNPINTIPAHVEGIPNNSTPLYSKKYRNCGMLMQLCLHAPELLKIIRVVLIQLLISIIN